MWGAAALVTFSIGLSRAYLGVHYPSDVLAGFTAAVVWTTMVRVGHHTFWVVSPDLSPPTVEGEQDPLPPVRSDP